MTFCHFTEKNAAVALRAALLLCIFVLIIMLCGCSRANNSPTNTDADTLPSDNIPAESEKPALTEAPAVTETPSVTEIPAATEAPAVTEIPAATEAPSVTEPPAATEAPAENIIASSFYAVPVEDEVFIRMYRCSYPEGCTVELSELRYVHVLHYDFSGNICEGELIVNAAIAEDIRDIFLELFYAEYPIEKVRLIDEYDADDEASMLDNNTSAFNYRTIAGTNVLSLHARGLAIDINPFYNPYVVSRSDGTTIVQPAGSEAYTDRTRTEPYIIKKADICYNAFISRGFTWGGDWNTKKDYQHFEKDID